MLGCVAGKVRETSNGWNQDYYRMVHLCGLPTTYGRPSFGLALKANTLLVAILAEALGLGP